MKLKDIGSLFKQAFKEWQEDKASRLAAALSYYTIFSLAPLLVIVIGIAGLVFDQADVQTRVIGQIRDLTGSEQTAEAIQTMISAAQNPTASLIATIIGVVTLLFGAAGVFGQLHDALNTIWEVAPDPKRGFMGLLKDRFLSFTMVLGIGFLLLVSLVVTAALSALDQFTTGLFPGFEFVFQLINFVVSFAVITLLFALIYKILPDVKIAWRDVWLGAAVTAFLFTLGRLLIGLYLGRQAISDAYGAAGSLIVILLWVYYSAQILFFGAEFTQVYANRYGSRIIPEKGAILLTEEARLQQGMPHRETLDGVQREQTGQAAPGAAPQPQLLPQAQPSVLAFSAVLAVLVGFVSGLVLRRGEGPKR